MRTDITYQAGTSITLKAGFYAKAGTDFLAKIEDCPQSGFETAGFVQRSNNDYLYDVNGNQTSDPHKGITTDYNYLNLPYKITFDNGNVIEWLYDAKGMKLQKLNKRNSVTESTLDYLGGNIEYLNDTLDAIYLEDAKFVFDKGVAKEYQFYLRDIVDNTRVVFRDSLGIPVMVNQSHYYPNGGLMAGIWQQDSRAKYLYNGIERVNDFGLDIYHAKYRTLDQWSGKWWQVDPFAEFAPNLTPYRFGFNNPILYSDPLGLFESRKEAKKYRKENDVKGKIRKQRDGSYAIENKKEGSFTTNDSELGIMTGALVTAKPTVNGNPVDRIAILVDGHRGGTIGGLDLLSGIGFLARISKASKIKKVKEVVEDLPVLDITRKIHTNTTNLPKVKDLAKYSKDQLTMFLKDLKISVQSRIRSTTLKGSDASRMQNRAHGQRQGAEQDLIKAIEKILGN